MGVGGGGGGSSTNTHPSRMSLKKLNLIGEKRIVIEILEDRQQKVRPQASGAFRVWAQRLANPENSIEVNSKHIFSLKKTSTFLGLRVVQELFLLAN